MNAVEYTKKLSRVAAVSWLGSLILFLGLASLHIIPFNEFLPFCALLAGTVPIVVFMRSNKATCEACDGQMRISSGFPRIVFRCRKCRSEIDTGIHSDY